MEHIPAVFYEAGEFGEFCSVTTMASSWAEDKAYQHRILQGVSRTFALTIPQLPEPLCEVVSNAYLLCRIADTIEDDSGLSSTQKREFCDRFVAVVEGIESPEGFAKDLYPLLSKDNLADERDLIQNTPRVIRLTHSYNSNQRRALTRCVQVMAEGMAYYQEKETLDGLDDLPAMDGYCYYVAGVVGEMLAELFCDYSEAINTHHEELRRLAVSFGQGLQMTNILKDIWEDHDRGACWLPRDLFLSSGMRLQDLSPHQHQPGFERGLEQLISVALGHLSDALEYTLIIPRHETGIRKFCLWAIGMAVLTLRKINRHRDFSSGQEVKISRNSVRASIYVTNIAVRHNALLRILFRLGTKGLPKNNIREKIDMYQYDVEGLSKWT